MLRIKTYKFYTKKCTFLYKKVLNTNEFSLESLDLLNNNYSNNYKSSNIDFITNTKLLSRNIYISNRNNIVYTSNYYNDLLNVLDINILLDNNSNSNYIKYNKINKLIKNNFCSLNKW